MLEPLRQFMLAKTPSRAQALQTLRAIFLAMFLTQVGLALLLGVVLLLLGGGQGSSPLLAQTFIAMSLLLLPVTLFSSSQMAAVGGKQAALSATLLNAVILSTPAWFLSFALAVGTAPVYLLLLAAVLMAYYALGLFTLNAFARFALLPSKKALLSQQGVDKPEQAEAVEVPGQT